MIQLPTLYPHQEDVRDRTRDALRKRWRVILCAPPGMGKTRIAKWILGAASTNRAAGHSGISLFTVHRRGLVDNAVKSFSEKPYVPHGVIMSGRPPRWEHKTQVASIDTLLAWFITDNRYTLDYTFDLIVWDEAHSHHTKFARFLNLHDQRREELGMPPAFVIGLTATPQAKGLADIYKEIILGPPTQWLIDNGFLSPFRYYRATQGQLDKLVKRGGEFTNTSVCDAMDGLAGDLVRDWKQYAEGRPTVGFFPRRSHAQDATVLLEQAGLRVAYVDGTTPDEERNAIFQSLNNHEIDYLCNVQVVERGTDIPAIACVQMCVSVASVTRWRQMIGRGSRPDDGIRKDRPNVPAKTDCIVLDHGGNLLPERELGFFEDDPNWSLDVTTKDPGEAGTRPTIQCPNCPAVYRGGKCRNCGYEPTPKERKAQGLVFDGSELQEITRKDQRAKKQKTAEQLMIAALYRAGKSGRTWRQAFGIFKRMNEKQGTNCRVPKTVEVGGHRYEMLQFDSSDGSRKVATLYPFTNGKHGGPYEIQTEQAADAPY